MEGRGEVQHAHDAIATDSPASLKPTRDIELAPVSASKQDDPFLVKFDEPFDARNPKYDIQEKFQNSYANCAW